MGPQPACRFEIRDGLTPPCHNGIPQPLNFAPAPPRDQPDRRGLDTAMLIAGKPTSGVWIEADGWSIGIIDQTTLPYAVATLPISSLSDAAHAIASMKTSGAPVIGAVAAYGMCLALPADPS